MQVSHLTHFFQTDDSENLNPFAPEPPVTNHDPCTACDVISFNGQGQLWQATCPTGKDLSKLTKYPAKSRKNGARKTKEAARRGSEK